MLNDVMRDVKWVGDSREQVRSFPKSAKKIVGQALNAAQSGRKHINAKPLRGGVGAGVFEIAARYNTNTYRAIYAVKLGENIYSTSCISEKIHAWHWYTKKRN